MITRLNPAIFTLELPVPELPVWEPIAETLGGRDEREWGLWPDDTLAATYEGPEGVSIVDNELTPVDHVSFLFF